MTTETQEVDFATSMKKLNNIVDNLEKGDLTLDKALKLYEEGVKMSQLCAKRLDDAGKRIEILIRSAGKGLEAVEADETTLKPKSKSKRK